MKLSNLALAAAVATFALPALSNTASAYQCSGALYASDGIGQRHAVPLSFWHLMLLSLAICQTDHA